MQIFLGYSDLLKDSILLSKLVTAFGGLYTITMNLTKFSTVVSYYEYTHEILHAVQTLILFRLYSY